MLQLPVQCASFGYCEQVLDKKLQIASATLAMPLEENGSAAGGLLDIREDYDEGLHGPTKVHTAEAFTSASHPAQQPAAGEMLRRRSVTFADEQPASTAAPLEDQNQKKFKAQQPGMKKGFLDRPKPALKKSSVRAWPAAQAASGPVKQSDTEDRKESEAGRDAAFSGTVVEREPTRPYKASGGLYGASQADSTQRDSVSLPMLPRETEQQQPIPGNVVPPVAKKVSRFKQQRAQT